MVPVAACTILSVVVFVAVVSLSLHCFGLFGGDYQPSSKVKVDNRVSCYRFDRYTFIFGPSGVSRLLLWLPSLLFRCLCRAQTRVEIY